MKPTHEQNPVEQTWHWNPLYWIAWLVGMGMAIGIASTTKDPSPVFMVLIFGGGFFVLGTLVNAAAQKKAHERERVEREWQRQRAERTAQRSTHGE